MRMNAVGFCNSGRTLRAFGNGLALCIGSEIRGLGLPVCDPLSKWVLSSGSLTLSELGP